MSKVQRLTVKDLRGLLDFYEKQGRITGETQIVLASDEEGNSYSNLVKIGNMSNISVSKKHFTMYPATGFEVNMDEEE